MRMRRQDINKDFVLVISVIYQDILCELTDSIVYGYYMLLHPHQYILTVPLSDTNNNNVVLYGRWGYL